MAFGSAIPARREALEAAQGPPYLARNAGAGPAVAPPKLLKRSQQARAQHVHLCGFAHYGLFGRIRWVNTGVDSALARWVVYVWGD